jgi:hypothetical protein
VEDRQYGQPGWGGPVRLDQVEIDDRAISVSSSRLSAKRLSGFRSFQSGGFVRSALAVRGGTIAMTRTEGSPTWTRSFVSPTKGPAKCSPWVVQTVALGSRPQSAEVFRVAVTNEHRLGSQ